MKYVYEIHKYGDGSHMHAVFSTRRAALKSMLVLRRREVQRGLDDYKLFGREFVPKDSYVYCWEDITLSVEKLEIHE